MRPIKSLAIPGSLPVAQPATLTNAAQLEQFMRLVGQRFVLFYPVLSTITGSANAALMLGHMLYWSRSYLTKHPERGGWFWHTCTDWETATGLSRHEQDNARLALKNSMCVEERLMGVPARMHYRVNLDELGRRLAQHLQQKYQGWAWDDALVRGLLGSPIAYQRVFADVTGNSAAALYLSDLCQTRRMLNTGVYRARADVDGDWMDLPLITTAKRIGRSTKSLRTARNILLALKLIEERTARGVPPRLLTRINLQQLVKLVTTKISLQQTTATVTKLPQVVDSSGMAETYIPEVPKPANWDGGNVHSRSAETGKLEVPKPANKIAGNVTPIKGFSTTKAFGTQQPLQQTSAAVRRRSSCDENQKGTSNPVQAKTVQLEKAVQPMQASVKPIPNGLLFPDWLQSEIASSARQAVAKLPSVELQQQVIDEWIGKLRKQQGSVANQLGYLIGIVRNAQLGTFTPTIALEVALARKQSAAHAAAMDRARNQQPHIEITTSQPESVSHELKPHTSKGPQDSFRTFQAAMNNLGLLKCKH